MQSSNQPGKISLPFASSGAKQPIPVASQIGTEDGRASYTDGFPPLTRTPLAAGGKPPFGTDMNGVLNAITAIQQWQSAGGLFTYDAALSASIGGYPKGALLLKADASGYWQSTAENNTTNPDAAGAGWISSSPHGSVTFTTSGSFTVPFGVTTIWRTACGGGGGGGASPATTSNISGGGGGGGAGDCLVMAPLSVTPGQVLSFTIGAGGTSGANGGATIVGGVTLNGGSSGGTASAGGVGVAFGGSGGAGYPRGSDGSDASNTAGAGNGAPGASGPFGGGGGGARSTYGGTARAGYNAAVYGAGGGGAGGLSLAGTQSGAPGGTGSGGIIIFQW